MESDRAKNTDITRLQGHGQKKIWGVRILGDFALNLVLFSYSSGFLTVQKFISGRFEPEKC